MGKHSKPHQRPNFRHQNNRGHDAHGPRRNSNWRGPNKNRNWNDQKGNSQYGKENYSQAAQRSSLREDQVGITEYINPNTAGFTAVIKSRYSDFHVNEIDLNDEVLVLNNLDVPKEVEDAPLDGSQLAEIRECFKDVISEETWQKIEALAKSPKASTETIEIDFNDVDKDKRTQFHAMLKQVYTGNLVSTTNTLDVGGVQMRFLRISRRKNKSHGNRRTWTFPAEYVHFLVHKENMDTSEVASHIAQNLHLINSKVNFCGTKDKRAITTQKFCIKRRKPADILASIRTLRNVKIGNFSFSEKVLKLGDLHGNRFRIALRHITTDESLIERALLQLRETGFINYYGLQRFGNCADVPTYEVGVALVKADYKKACELILKPRSSDPPFLKEIREKWWENRDSKAACDMLRSNRFIEKKLLAGLAKFGENDYATAIRRLPRNLLLLYPHAFQSLVFNRIASRRIKEYGLKIMAGDLVYRDKANEFEDDGQIEVIGDVAIDDGDEADGGDIGDPEDGDGEGNASDCENTSTPAAAAAASNEGVDETKIESEYKQRVRAVTEEEIANGTFTIYDVVLPLPGYDIKYPENVLDEWYKETLQEFDLTSEALNHNVKTFKMAGAYRKLVVLPKDLTWEFRNFEENHAQLIWSDWDLLRKSNEERDSLSKNEGKQRALLLDFCLPTSCYATMLLRELLKTDTSSANQVSLETEAKEQQEKQKEDAKKATKKDEIHDTNTNDQHANDPQINADAPKEMHAKKRSIELTQSDTADEVSEPINKITRTVDATE